MIRTLLAVAVAALGATLLFSGATARSDTAAPPVLVELFTSQGCSSCPPAEHYLVALAKRGDLVALSMHVNYWDYIGWKDRFASQETTDRQRAYGQRIGRGRVYTPQMVIDGVLDAVGSRRNQVDRAIASAQAEPGLKIAIELALAEDGDLQITLPGADYSGAAAVWLARYDREHRTEVERGENAGRILHNVNVVRELRQIAIWTGQPLDIRLPADALSSADGAGNDGCVIIVQDDGFGQVLGVRMMALAEGDS